MSDVRCPVEVGLPVKRISIAEAREMALNTMWEVEAGCIHAAEEETPRQVSWEEDV